MTTHTDSRPMTQAELDEVQPIVDALKDDADTGLPAAVACFAFIVLVMLAALYGFWWVLTGVAR